MEQILYFDCFSGISGDMIAGALLDLGAAEENLRQKLTGLNLDGYSLQINRNHKKNIWGTDFRVLLNEKAEHHHHNHEHRGLNDIRVLITESNLSDTVKKQSLDIFERIAEAESHIHGISPDEVHFHEVGAVDSIVDIVSALICLEELGIEKICSSPLHLGDGFVNCAHGLLPVPAPAVLEILEGVPVYSIKGIGAELVTPTGAAIISYLTDYFGPLPEMMPEATGYGLGDRDLEIPNILRVIKGKKAR